MADKKEASSSGPNLLWSTIAALFVLLIITTYLGKIELFSGGSGKVSGLDAVVPAGDARLGEDIVNRLAIPVRQTPGGQIIGEQAKRALGTIMEGPRTAFGSSWIRVDYRNDPDGWVLLDDVTTNVGLFRAVNIFPIFFDLFRPVGIVLTLIFVVLLVLVLLKRKRVSDFEAKKKQTEADILAQQTEAARPVSSLALDPSAPLNLPGVPANLPVGLPEGLVFAHEGADQTGAKNSRWDHVEQLIQSTVASDWRQAVIEADIILDEMLTRIGYEGDSIGDKLKQIEQSDFITLNKAWEAHKVRNHLAHRGSDYVFPKNEAERVIGLYRQVFQEFYYI